MHFNNIYAGLILFMFALGVADNSEIHNHHDHNNDNYENHKNSNNQTPEDHHHSNHNHDKENHKEGEHKEHNHHEDNLIRLSEKELKEFGVTFTGIQQGKLENYLKVNGEVEFNEEKLLHVSPRFSGIIKKIFVQVGDLVKKDQPLVVIENSTTLANFTIRASQQGVVIKKHAGLGETAEPGTNIFVIADLNQVWMNLTVYPEDIAKVKIGQRVSFIHDSGSSSVEGTVTYLSPVADLHTRTFQARVILSNKKKKWFPGSFVSAHLHLESGKEGLLVPNSSVMNFKGNKVVFVKNENGIEVRSVTSGESNEWMTLIVGGLKVDETIVSENAFVIKSELLKGELGHAGHVH